MSAPDSAAWESTIPDRWRAACRAHAHRLAVSAGGETLTYAELDARSNAIARAVLVRGEAAREPVALLMDKRPRLVAAFLGALAAGRLVLPLDPSHPAGRLAQICAGAGASLLVTDATHRALAGSLGAHVPAILDLDAAPLDPGTAAPRLPLWPDSLATLLYTSGSTGEPKGVAQSHRGALHDADNLMTRVRLGPADRMALVLALGTVGSIRDVLATLLSGGSVHLFDLGAAGFPALAAWLRGERITYTNLVATLFRHFAAALTPDARFPDIRVMRVGSEAVALSDLDALQRHFPPRCLLSSGFSATETATATRLFMEIDSVVAGGQITAGHAAPGFGVRILDEVGRPCAAGELGEIAIASPYLALGYWRRPELTALAFRPDPEGDGARMYMTGDLGRLRDDGSLELAGRRDARIKIHGVAVHPAEVELAVQAMPGIAQAAVAVRTRAPGDPRLVAYVVPVAEGGPSAVELRRHLRDRLPATMLPSAVVFLPALPSSETGKVNHRALPEPDWTQVADYVAPRTPLEQLLAAMWAEALAVDRVGADDGFVELGGDSLRALALVDAIRARLGLELSAGALLAAATVGEMAVLVTGALAGRLPDGARDPWLGRSGD